MRVGAGGFRRAAWEIPPVGRTQAMYSSTLSANVVGGVGAEHK